MYSNDKSETEIVMLSFSVFSDICQLRKDEGECRGYQPSWYYDAQLGRCIAFVWGGCGGNANRFENILDCRAKCGPRTEPPVQPTEQVLMGLGIYIIRFVLYRYRKKYWLNLNNNEQIYRLFMTCSLNRR